MKNEKESIEIDHNKVRKNVEWWALLKDANRQDSNYKKIKLRNRAKINIITTSDHDKNNNLSQLITLCLN